ncbi:MAG: tRNA (adenosine(37)-N6)-threonylcarbamoyltransferase complex dimerization subunit type 1 TsaB [Planctomycetaceae bacterium]
MNFLAVETSGRSGSIALLCDGHEPYERTLASDGRRHAQTLIADAAEMMTRFKLTPKETDCVCVSEGPGSFTGLRVGIVFAKTFGWLNKCPVVSIPTLEACAAQVEGTHICVISDAQRGEVFLGEYLPGPNRPQALAKVEILSLEAARKRLTPSTTLTGPGLTKYAADFSESCVLADSKDWHPRATTIGQLGKHALDTGDIADPWKLEPFYLRRSAAEENKSRRATESSA